MFNFVERVKAFKEVSHSVPTITPFVVKYYKLKADIYHQLEFGECGRIQSRTPVMKGRHAVCPDLSVLPFDICLASTRQQLMPDGVAVTVYADGVLVA